MIKIKVGNSKYPEYFNPNRQEWNDSIPKGWTQKRIAFNTKLLTGFAFKSEQFSFDDGIRLVRGDNVTEGKLRWGNKERRWPLMRPEFESFLLEEGDILIGMDGSKVGKNYAMVRNKDLPLLLVQRVARLRTDDELHPRFLYYCIGNKLFLYWITINKTDPMVPHITPKDITNYEIAFPSYKEQTLISRFLDQKTSHIDQLIEQKEKLLKLLAEKRTAIITQAVTKGLDPDMEMRDSGIDWLGEIPKEWEVWKTTHGFEKIGSGTTPKSDNPEYYNGGIPWVTTSELREKHISETSQKITELALEKTNLKFYSPGAIVIAMYGATIGRLGIMKIKATVNQACCVFDKPTQFEPMFLYYWLWMARDSLISLSSGGGQPNLSQDDLKQLRIPRPDKVKQKEIADHIEANISKIFELEEKIDESIKQLKEYREALITAAVTGQIDVRKEVVE